METEMEKQDIILLDFDYILFWQSRSMFFFYFIFLEKMFGV